MIICLFAILFSKTQLKNLRNSFIYFSIFIAALTVSALILITLADKSIFLKARDYLLLSNRPGIAINNFYYTYTPYAAQAINTPFQKQVKSCWIDPEIAEQENPAVLVSRFGWFNTPNRADSSFLIKKSSEDNLIFQYNNKNILSVSLKDFHQNPAAYLKQYSKKTDPAFFIRFLCTAGLFTGLPAFCFIVLFWFIFLVCSKFLTKKNAMFLSGTLISGLTMISLLYLNSANRPADIKDIQKLLKEASINVKCASIKALSKLRCNDEHEKFFKNLIINSPEWYVQQYAYNALKECRWEKIQ